MQLSINDGEKKALLDDLGKANLIFQHQYPGDRPDRQPVHTVYGGANLFRSDTCVKMGETALKNLHAYAPDFAALVRVLGLEGHESLPHAAKEVAALAQRLEKMGIAEGRKERAWLAWAVYARIVGKLEEEQVEDFRIDFEDGFGNRPDAEEDETALHAADELALGMKNKTIAPFIGIRIKPFTEDLKWRGVRTLDLFLTRLLKNSGGQLPANFVVMLPKVTIPEQ